jgi:uncharacterized protein (UPF0262 family)
MSQSIKNFKLLESKQLAWTAETNHDLKVAIYDLLEQNYCLLLNRKEKIFNIAFQIEETNMTLEFFSFPEEISLRSITVNVRKLLKIVREYIVLCDSYYSAIKSSPVAKVEAMDVGRRSLHDLASKEFIEKLKKYIDMDLNTARRFVTLISILLRSSSASFDTYSSER